MASYSPSDISALLQVKESTLRKYSLLLEECGYKFDRNDQKQRWYSDKDVIAFQKLVTFKQNGDMNLKSCAEAVYLWSRGGDVTEVSSDTHNATGRHNSDMTPVIHQEMIGMRELIEEQRELIKSLYEQLERQDASQKERDRLLLNSIEQLQNDFQQQRDEHKTVEEKKMLQGPEEEKPSFWNRLFKK